MMKTLRSILTMLLMVTWAGTGIALSQDGPQDVTLRDLNHYDDLTSVSQINSHPLANDTVRFTAVVISNPLNSGLASIVDVTTPDGEELRVPGRIHVFVVDTTAASEGKDGMYMHIVRGSTVSGNFAPSYEALLTAQVGDIIQVTGRLTFFGFVAQFDPLPTSDGVELLGNVQESFFSHLEDLLEPTVISISDINEETEPGSGLHSMKLGEYSKYANRYVRFEQVEAFASSSFAEGSRFNMLFTDGNSFLYTRDTSLRFRNDGARYEDTSPTFNFREEPFTPPPSGALVNTGGFLLANENDGFNVEGSEAMFGFAPMDDSDMEVIGNPPLFASYSISSSRPATDEPVTISVQALPAAEDEEIGSVNVVYSSTGAQDEVTEAMTDAGDDTYEFTFPTFEDHAVVSFRIDAATTVDFEGQDIDITARLRDGDITADSDDPVKMQFLVGDIDRVLVLNRTATERFGFSPLVNMDDPIDMNITGTVVADSSDGFVVIHDSNEKWSGIVLGVGDDPDLNALKRGDKINITQGDVVSDFDNTYLRVLEFDILTETESDIESLIPVVNVTDLSNSFDRGKPYFGMLVRLEDTYVFTNNADGPDSDFGEWAIAQQEDSTVTLRVNNNLGINPVRIGNNIPDGFNATIIEGVELESILGVLHYSFGDSKLALRGREDITTKDGQTLTSIYAEELQPNEYKLSQNYPNPFNPTTNINYVMPEQAHVRITVYDVLGREVAMLVNEVMSAGTHTVNFDAARLSSGMYIYRMEAGSKILTNKMMLIK